MKQHRGSTAKHLPFLEKKWLHDPPVHHLEVFPGKPLTRKNPTALNVTKIFCNSSPQLLSQAFLCRACIDSCRTVSLPKTHCQLWVPRSTAPASGKLHYYTEDTIWDSAHKPWCKMNSGAGGEFKKQQKSSGHLGSVSSPHLLRSSEKSAAISWRGRTSSAEAEAL